MPSRRSWLSCLNTVVTPSASPRRQLVRSPTREPATPTLRVGLVFRCSTRCKQTDILEPPRRRGADSTHSNCRHGDSVENRPRHMPGALASWSTSILTPLFPSQSTLPAAGYPTPPPNLIPLVFSYLRLVPYQ